MARQKISRMHERARNALGPAPLEYQVLRDVVAIIALRLRVARSAQRPVGHRQLPVAAHELPLVPQEGLRHGAPQILARMTRRAFAAVPLGLVLVAAEALTHRRDVRLPRAHHTSVAADALSFDAFHAQVLIVIEANVSVGSVRHDREHAAELVGVVPVAAGAEAFVRQLVNALALRG
jgi:hypothetical protein